MRGAASAGAGAAAAADAAAALLRKINLIELLRDEAGPGADEGDGDAMLTWTEAEIRSYFAGGPAAGVPPPAGGPAVAAGAAASPPVPQGPSPPPRTWPDPEPSELLRWFPALGRLAPGGAGPAAPAGGGQTPAGQAGAAGGGVVVLCFPNSGSCEDIYTSEGTGSRRAPSQLLDWCCATGARLMAVQPPGRAARAAEPPCPDLASLAAALLPVAAPALARARRWFVVGHSMGAWAAFEFLRLAQAEGLPMPAAAFFSAMPSPDCPEERRPWRQQATLGEEEFKEECRAWGVNAAVFSPDLWHTYQPLLRADFRLFDEYPPVPPPAPPPFDFPLFAFWGEADGRVQSELVAGWARFTAGECMVEEVPGAEHLWTCNGNGAAKRAWLQRVVDGMAGAG